MLSGSFFNPLIPVEKPGYFVDRDRVVDTVKRCIYKKTRPCSIVGGMGMGKTSILNRLTWEFSYKYQVQDASRNSCYYLPIYSNLYPRKSRNLRHITEQLIDETILQAITWLKDCETEVAKRLIEKLQDLDDRIIIRPDVEETNSEKILEAFEKNLWHIIRDFRYGEMSNTKFLFLIDGIYYIEDSEVGKAWGRYWLNLFDDRNEKALRSHTMAIMTCLKDHHEQFVKGTSTPNTFEKINLDVFKKTDAYRIIKLPFEKNPDIGFREEVASTQRRK